MHLGGSLIWVDRLDVHQRRPQFLVKACHYIQHGPVGIPTFVCAAVEKTVEELTARLESARAAMKPRKVSDLSQPPCTKHGRAAGSVLIDH